MHRLSIYSPERKQNKSDYPISPYVHLSLGVYSSAEDGNILISPQLMSHQEIDETVDQLIAELEEFRQKAKNEIDSIIYK